MKFKKRYIALASLLVILIAVWFFMDEGWIFNTKTISTDATVRIKAAGLDLRGYEFTPESAPYMQCVFVAGTQKSGLFCFEKRELKQ